jgi:hypothetical protein
MKTNKQQQPRPFVIAHDDINTFDPSVIPGSRLNPMRRSNVAQRMISDNNSKRSFHDSNPTENQLDQSAHKEESRSLTESQDTLTFKFEKIKRMSEPYFSSETPDVILENLARQVLYDGGKESSVDEYLAELRQKVNQIEALDHLFPSKRPISSRDISEQRMQQGSVDNPSFRDLPEAARLSYQKLNNY